MARIPVLHAMALVCSGCDLYLGGTPRASGTEDGALPPVDGAPIDDGGFVTDAGYLDAPQIIARDAAASDAGAAGSNGYSAVYHFQTGAQPTALALADLDGNGSLDIVTANEAGDSVTILLNTTARNTATPTFTRIPDVTVGGGPTSVLVGDMNRDGRPDLVVVNSTSKTAAILLNTTSPGAAAPSFALPVGLTLDRCADGYCGNASLADLNGDGNLDLVIGASVETFINTTPAGALSPTMMGPVDFPTNSSGDFVETVGDLNLDGIPDIAVSDLAVRPALMSVLVGTTSLDATMPSFRSTPDYTAGNYPGTAMANADLTGDALPELVLCTNDGLVLVFPNTTDRPLQAGETPTFGLPITAGTQGCNGVALADLDGDGRVDMVTTTTARSEVSV